MPGDENRLPAITAAEAVRAPACGERRYLSFSLGGETFAIGILSIRGMVEYDELRPIPMAPPFIRGVIRLDGAVVPVVDLAVRCGRPPHAVTRRSCIVVIEVESRLGSQEMGVVVDAFSELSTGSDPPAAAHQAFPPPPTPTDLNAHPPGRKK